MALPPAARTWQARGAIWSVIVIGFLFTLGSATAGLGILLLWLGLAFGLKASAAVKLGGGFLGALALGALGIAIGSTAPAAPDRPSAVSTAAAPAAAKTPAASRSAPDRRPPEPIRPATSPTPLVGAQWDYSHEVDAMTGKTSAFAVVSSRNTVAFDFPYQGDQRGRLTLRQHSRFGNDVIFSIERGQLLCPSYDGCSVLVRFDDKPPSTFHARPPADHSSETIFLSNYARFVSGVRAAKTVRVAPPIYQQGDVVFEFDVSGFDMKKFRGGGR